MKFPISSNVWLLSTTAIYIVICLFNIFLHKFSDGNTIQFIWLAVTSLPLYVPMQKLVKMDPFWSKKK